MDLEKKSVSYAGAGHPPLLLWRASTAQRLGSGGEWPIARDYSLLETYSVIEMPVEPGDKVVLYTDGIVETESPSEQEFGLDLFKGFLESNHHLKANLFADALLDELSNWSEHPKGQGQKDDITFLTIDFSVSEEQLIPTEHIGAFSTIPELL